MFVRFELLVGFGSPTGLVRLVSTCLPEVVSSTGYRAKASTSAKCLFVWTVSEYRRSICCCHRMSSHASTESILHDAHLPKAHSRLFDTPRHHSSYRQFTWAFLNSSEFPHYDFTPHGSSFPCRQLFLHRLVSPQRPSMGCHPPIKWRPCALH